MKNTIVFMLLLLFGNLTYAYENNNKDMMSTLRVGISLNQPPFSFENQSGKPDGLSIKLWEEVAEKLNIKFVYVTLEGKKDNSMQMLADKKLDVLVSPSRVKFKSVNAIEFSRPYFMGKTGLAVSAFGASKIELFIETLANLSWMIILVYVLLFIFIGLLIWLVERKENHSLPSNFFKGVGMAIWREMNSFTEFNEFRVATPKGKAIHLIGTFLLFTFTVSTLVTISLKFSGSIRDGKALMIQKIEDINNKRIAIVEGDPSTDYIRSLGAKLVKTETSVEGLKMIKNKEVSGFVGNYYLTNYLVHKTDAHEVAMSPLTITNTEYTFAFPKGSPLVTSVDSMIVKFQDNNVASTLCAKYIGNEYAAQCIF